jgi:hypothetical protein
MADHLACAERSRLKAHECEQAAKGVTSPLFAECYRELAQLFTSIAKNEEDFARSDMKERQKANDSLISQLDAA